MVDGRPLHVPVPPEKWDPRTIKHFVTDLSQSLTSGLRDRFTAPYQVAVEDPLTRDGDWEQALSVREGAKVGAEVQLKWSGADPAVITIDVSQNSKLDSYILLAVTMPLLFVGGYMGHQDVPPLEFLPGRKLATALGVLIGLLVALPIVALLRSALGRDAQTQNERLVTTVRATVAELAARFAEDAFPNRVA
jgi:hypothetical protein